MANQQKNRTRERIVVPKPPLNDTLENAFNEEENDDGTAYRVVDKLEVENKIFFALFLSLIGFLLNFQFFSKIIKMDKYICIFLFLAVWRAIQ